MESTITWIGIAFCITQSAMFSGSNLAFYRLSRLQLEVEAKRDERASRVLRLREDSNFLLATILWGNVAINVLLGALNFLDMDDLSTMEEGERLSEESIIELPVDLDLVVHDQKTTLGDVIRQLKLASSNTDEQIHNDVVLIWVGQRRIITGSDILARLLTGIGKYKYA